MSSMKPWIVIYHHKYGADAWACASEDEAICSVVGVVMEYIDDLEAEDQKTVLQNIIDGEFSDAITLYAEKCEENFDIVQPCEEQELTPTDKGLKKRAQDLLTGILKEENDKED